MSYIQFMFHISPVLRYFHIFEIWRKVLYTVFFGVQTTGTRSVCNSVSQQSLIFLILKKEAYSIFIIVVCPGGAFSSPTARRAEGLLHLDCVMDVCVSYKSSPVIGRHGS